MKRRLFVALPLPEDAADALAQEATTLAPRMQTFARFLAQDTWHFTLVFLGDQQEENIPALERAVRDATATAALPPLTLERIVYGPVGAPPRMVWLVTDGASSAALGTFKNALEDRLEAAGIRWDRDRRPYHGHLTLARFRREARGPFPPLNRPFHRTIVIPSADLLESRLERSGAEYTVLASVATA